MKEIFMGIPSIITLIIGASMVKLSGIVIFILGILKLAGLTHIPWFAGPLTAAAISTGLWMLLFGLIFIVISLGISKFIFLKDKK